MHREPGVRDIFLSVNAHSLIQSRHVQADDWMGSRRFIEMQSAAPMLIAS
jgi:hypothetical protein